MNHSKKLLAAILSLSMATALVGTGIAPALQSISEYFQDAPALWIQMIVSLPSLLMVLVAIPFSAISNRLSMRDICVIGLVLYTIGGLWGAVADDIYTMMFTRVVIGAGSGLLMPMSVGLLSYFFDREEQHRLNGYIVILTSVISILSMVLVGYLADLSWRLVFLVYLFGIPCIWLSWRYIPKTVLKSPKNRVSVHLLRQIWAYAIGIFVMMILYFAMLNNCSTIATSEGTVGAAHIGAVMSIQTVTSLLTGVYMEKLKRLFGRYTKIAIWVLAFVGMAALCVPNSFPALVAGLAIFGVALAMAVGMFNSQACIVCDKEESLSAMSVMSFTRCLGQFGSPVVLAGLQLACGSQAVRFPYYAGAVMAVLMLLMFLPVHFVPGQVAAEAN